MDTLIIIGAFQSFLLSALLLTKRERATPDWILSGYFFISGLTILLAFMEIYNRKMGYPYPAILNLSPPLILLHGPLLWLYIKSLTKQNFQLKPFHAIHLLPFLFTLVFFWIGYYSLPVEERILLETSNAVRNEPLFYLVVGLIAISSQSYFAHGIHLIRGYRKNLKNYFARTESIDLKWLKFLIISAIIFYASVSGLYILDIAIELLPYGLLQLVGFIMGALFVLALGFFGLRHGSVFASQGIKVNVERASAIPISETSLSPDEEKFVHLLLNHIKEQRPYLNPDITLAKLSQDVRVSPDYLSGILNGRLGMNFFDFINHYRIEAFKEKCKNPNNRNLTLLSLAFDCGFNSKATFNRVFKREVGITPSKYYSNVSRE